MLELLDDLEREFGTHSEILDTRADYLDDAVERRSHYTKALILARERDDQDEVKVVLQSLRDLEDDIVMDSATTTESQD